MYGLSYKIDCLIDVLVEGGESGITFTFTRDGRASGEAYVRLATPEDQAAALDHNREHIGNRYIEGTLDRAGLSPGWSS